MIVATTRTLNEEANIERFCRTYGSFCDAVVIVDGGSEDRTVEIAESLPGVVVHRFAEQVTRGETWRNPHGKHINLCTDIALSMGTDWVIFDDCDCAPTRSLQKQARSILENTQHPVVLLYRLYVYGTDKYFPEMNRPGQSLWAWRSGVPVRAREDDPWSHEMRFPAHDVLRLENPLSVLHYFAPDEETVQRKMNFYRVTKEQPNVMHPKHTNGPLASLPEWAVC